jgi:hypothetical protein
LLLPF